MQNISILSKAAKTMISLEPFPHIIIENALPALLAEKLTNEFPLDCFDLESNNCRLDIPASKIQSFKSITQAWHEFIQFHSSEAFLNQILDLFSEHVNNSILLENKNFYPGVRGEDLNKKNNIFLDAQISVNTPVTIKSSVRGIHTDNTNKLYSGLFYLRLPNDYSEGGDLELYKWNEGYSLQEKIKYYKEGIDLMHVKKSKKIKYKNNLAIIFLNSIDSLHAVTPREITNKPRCFVNLVGELDRDIFQKYGYWTLKINKLRQIFRSLINNLK